MTISGVNVRSNLLGNPLHTEVLQCFGGGIALSLGFSRATPGADDDTPDWISREHGRPTKKNSIEPAYRCMSQRVRPGYSAPFAELKNSKIGSNYQAPEPPASSC